MNSDDNPISNDPFALIDPQLWLITSASQNRRSGLIATFVTKASIVPDCPRFVIGLARQHETCRLLEESGTCVLHLFSQEKCEWVEKFGVPSGAKIDKFAQIDIQTLKTGAPVLSDAICAFDCQVERNWETGDRILFLLQVVESKMLNPGTPLRFTEMWNTASTELCQKLSFLLVRDQQIDRQAIMKWREASE
ncbi:flavin reductase family protein [Rubinisphaera italica]|uniref:High molecular weight rubredoxin n=1 Tax=Rubinisphaera italica TaxID=2527969 RepID=A0A5C5XJA9_9PLAN|nr:flavin reductase family protein [Rubinisphaera italica]TWT62195.1 High molecular weight rubredoxin [Rubinisphaera italica]